MEQIDRLIEETRVRMDRWAIVHDAHDAQREQLAVLEQAVIVLTNDNDSDNLAARARVYGALGVAHDAVALLSECDHTATTLRSVAAHIDAISRAADAAQTDLERFLIGAAIDVVANNGSSFGFTGSLRTLASLYPKEGSEVLFWGPWYSDAPGPAKLLEHAGFDVEVIKPLSQLTRGALAGELVFVVDDARRKGESAEAATSDAL